jgi:hypothetical protein
MSPDPPPQTGDDLVTSPGDGQLTLGLQQILVAALDPKIISGRLTIKPK